MLHEVAAANRTDYNDYTDDYEHRARLCIGVSERTLRTGFIPRRVILGLWLAFIGR